MPKVQAFSIPGLEVRFYSSDHLPPHIHVIDVGEWEIRVYFLRCTNDQLDYDIKWPKGFDGPQRNVRKQILQQVLKHRGDLFDEWERTVDY